MSPRHAWYDSLTGLGSLLTFSIHLERAHTGPAFIMRPRLFPGHFKTWPNQSLGLFPTVSLVATPHDTRPSITSDADSPESLSRHIDLSRPIEGLEKDPYATAPYPNPTPPSSPSPQLPRSTEPQPAK